MARLAGILILLNCAVLAGTVRGEPAELTISFGPAMLRFTTAQLLARQDAAAVVIPKDASYGGPRTYRAVPLLDLLAALPGGAADDPGFDTLQASASDGFVSQIPLSLIRHGATGGSVAWIAVDDPANPWPDIPGRQASAGPFYLVWTDPGRSNIRSEQWPYAVVSMTGVESPEHRWPQIAVSASLAADAPARRGQSVFVTQCMPCHRMLGGGAAGVGPDLGQPMNPTEYMTPTGLHALIRNPKAVRTWPEQRMSGFDATTLPDDDLAAVLAYLKEMAGHAR